MDSSNFQKDQQVKKLIGLALKTLSVFAGLVVLFWLFGLVVTVGNFMGWVPDSFYNTIETYLYIL